MKTRLFVPIVLLSPRQDWAESVRRRGGLDRVSGRRETSNSRRWFR